MERSLAEYAELTSRLGPLAALQRRLSSCSAVGELLALASVEAPRACGFERGIVLSVSDGRLTSAGMPALDDPACDELRRRAQANPIPLVPGSEELALIRRAEGSLRERPATGSAAKQTLALDQHVLAVVAPESHAVALLLLDRVQPPVTDADRATAELFAHLLSLALVGLVLRLRMEEFSAEIRHLTASAQALIHEAREAPISLTADFGHGPVFAAVGGSGGMSAELGALLSERERQVAALMAEGRSNREIGVQLHLAPDTVKKHVGRLVHKLGASNRVDAVARYVELSRSSAVNDR